MPAYQNYYNPYQSQQNQQMVYQTPYQQLQDMNYRQQTMFGNQPKTIVGGFVEDFSVITANDVPMQQPATFIKNDGSEIQVRNWNANGTISTTSYKPIIENQIESTENTSTDKLNTLNEDMKAFREEINNRFDKLEKAIATKPSSKARKEAVSDE